MLIKEKSVQNLTDIFNKQNNNDSDMLSTLATPMLLASGAIPSSHKAVADNFIIIKRLYKCQSVKACILNSERELLRKYNLLPLSQLSIQDVNKEILMLQQWAFSSNAMLRNDSDNIIQVRAKELRYILASDYSSFSSEMNNGFRALERYFEEITKFYNQIH